MSQSWIVNSGPRNFYPHPNPKTDPNNFCDFKTSRNFCNLQNQQKFPKFQFFRHFCNFQILMKLFQFSKTAEFSEILKTCSNLCNSQHLQKSVISPKCRIFCNLQNLQQFLQFNSFWSLVLLPLHFLSISSYCLSRSVCVPPPCCRRVRYVVRRNSFQLFMGFVIITAFFSPTPVFMGGLMPSAQPRDFIVLIGYVFLNCLRCWLAIYLSNYVCSSI